MGSSRKRVVWIILGSALVIGLIAGALLPLFNRKERFTELDRNMIRLKSMTSAVRIFENDTGGLLPPTLRAMVPTYLTEEAFRTSLYRDPSSGRTEDWLYYGDAAQPVAEDAIIIASPSTQICPPHLMHHRIIGHRDTVVEVITDEEFQRKMAAQSKSPRQ